MELKIFLGQVVKVWTRDNTAVYGKLIFYNMNDKGIILQDYRIFHTYYPKEEHKAKEEALSKQVEHGEYILLKSGYYNSISIPRLSRVKRVK